MGKKSGRRRGPTPHYRGKPLWQLLDNLPNHGVGRLIIRGSFKQEVEVPSFMRILEVDMSSKMVRKGKGKKSDKIKIPVIVEKVWRGVIFPRPVNIISTSHLSDFILVEKSEEEKYIKNAKTPEQVGFAHWNALKKRHMNTIRAVEAKQKEKERIAREEAEQAEREGRAINSAPDMQMMESNFIDNFKDNKERDTSGSLYSDYDPVENKSPKRVNTIVNKSGDQQKGKNYELCRNKIRSNRHNAQNQSGPLKEFYSKETMQEDFGEFSEQQNERIERMIKNGMNPDTAKQLEWERQTALATGADIKINKPEACPSSGLKRPMHGAQNEGDGDVKVAKIS